MRKPEISIIVPAHNEEGNIRKCVSSILKSFKGQNYELILVDDVSKDRTPQIVDQLARKHRQIHVIHREYPNGFGRAIRAGLQHARGDIIVPFMADLSDDPKTALKMVDKIREGYDISIASRFVLGGKAVGYPLSKYIAHRFYSKVVSLLFMRNIKDFSNAFKAYRRSILKGVKIESVGFEITSEMILKPIAMKNPKIIEVPTIWRNRKSGKAKFTGLYRQGMRYGRVMFQCLMIKFFRK